MSVVIASNLISLRLQTQIKRTVSELGSVYERLGSGLRINSAVDEPAGLALSNKLRSQSKLLAVSVRNANDGLSYVATADAGLAEITSLLERMSELANQGANSIYTLTQHSALQSEFEALGSEVERVAVVSQFNGFNTLNGSVDKTVQVGLTGDSSSTILISSVIATLADLSIGSAGALTYSLTGTSINDAVSASQLAVVALSSAIDQISLKRGVVGAASARLRSAINLLTVMRENTLAAESQIRDTDIAEDIAKLTRLNVLRQSQIALLAQANQYSTQVLKLLENS